MEQSIVSTRNEESRIKRECKGRALCITRNVSSLNNSKSQFYVKSESRDIFYFVEYKTDSQFCTCWDFTSHRADKCKHIYAVQYATRLGLVQQISKRLPIAQKQVHKSFIHSSQMTENFSVNSKPKSYLEDEYDF